MRKEYDLLLIATQPVVLPAETFRDYGGLLWMPSAAYCNFLEAFDAGATALLPQRPLPGCCSTVTDEGSYDVIVVGLGTAGAMAAMAAKQEGLSVLGIEKLPVCGGTSTAGRVTGYYFGYHGGLYTQVDEAAHQFDSSLIPMARLGSPLALPTLWRLLEEDAIIDAVPFTRSVLLVDREDLRFQYESHAIRALCEIAAKNPDHKPEIRERLQTVLAGKRLTVSLVNSPIRADYTDRFQKMVSRL